MLQSSDKVMLALSKIQEESSGNALGNGVLENAYKELSQRYDRKYGGFSGAPKFPTPHNMLFMLRHWKRTGDRYSARNGGTHPAIHATGRNL